MKKTRILRFRRNNLYANKTSSQFNTSVGEEKLDFSWTTLASLILTAFTAVSFGSGQAYRNAYLTPFNFDSMLIPWSFQDTVYLGIVKQIDIILVAPIWALLGVAVFAAILLFFFEMKNLQIKKKKLKYQNENYQNKTNKLYIALFLTFLTKLLAFGFIVILLGTFLVVKAEKLGVEDAKNDMSAILTPSKKGNEKAKKELRLVEIKRIVKKNIIEQGYLIDCNEHVCGIYAPNLGEKSSRIVRLDNVASFVIKKPFQ